MKQIIHIDNCPTTWNQIPTPKIEWLLTIYDRFPSDKTLTQAVALLGLNDMKVVSGEPVERGGKWYFTVRRGRTTFPIDAETVRYFSELFMGFLFNPSTLTRCPYPRLRIGWKRYAAPADRLATMNWIQFSDISLFHSRYRLVESRLQKALAKDTPEQRTVSQLTDELKRLRNQLLACFFTPVGKSYSQGQKHAFAHTMRRVSDAQFRVCLLFWEGCLGELHKQYVYLFAKGGTGNRKSDPLTEQGATQAVLMDRLKMDAETLCAQSAYAVLTVLDLIQHEAKVMKEAAQRNKTNKS